MDLLLLGIMTPVLWDPFRRFGSLVIFGGEGHKDMGPSFNMEEP